MEARPLTFVRSQEVARGTIAFYFEKPEGLTYKAGQYIDIEIINPTETDTGGSIRTFSLASAPHESELMIATRIRDSAFKRALEKLKPGEVVSMKAMGGSFTLHNKYERPAIMIAGGIGVTPFRSMVLDVAERNLPHRILLVSSNRTPEDAPFLDELKNYSGENKNIVFAPMFSKESGRLTADKIKIYTEQFLATANGALPIYYVVGSMDMVNTVRDMLEANGVDSDDIRGEEFPGY